MFHHHRETEPTRNFDTESEEQERMRAGSYRRDHLRALAQRVEVADAEVRIMGSKSRLLQTLTANGGVNLVPTQELNWRTGWECTKSAKSVT